MTEAEFAEAFHALTGNPPFPWQTALFRDWFAVFKFPDSCNLPTGLGKTSVVAVWLIALANDSSGKIPRRLVYVVNRRTVVDQTTTEVERYASLLAHGGPPVHPAILDLAERLKAMAADPKGRPLAISTLRGQFADNREWSADPARPAVIVGTVDMIGSRLLFSGYGVGFKGKPLHAGFLGQDALLVHDEAHLEPAFQRLLEAIRDEQKRCNEFRPFRVMELSATSRGISPPFELTPEEKAGDVPVVKDRLFAKKGVALIGWPRTDLAKEIGKRALRHKGQDKAVLVFVRTIDDVNAVRSVIVEKTKGVQADQVQVLTGTLRGLERDRLAESDPVFARFMPRPKVEPKKGTVYLICTSAGEVGVDISADHMVSDLTPLDSMAQRFGRVNRRGGGEAKIDVVYETDPDPKNKDKPYETARWATLSHLRDLPACAWIAEDRREASPHETGTLIRKLTKEDRTAAFVPEPTFLPTSDILFDAWALTTIRDKLPGRPKVEPYLHGVGGWEPAETNIAWRQEVWELEPRDEDDDERAENRKQLPKLAADLLEDYPLKPHELLRNPTYRVIKELAKFAAAPNTPAWVVTDEGEVTATTLGGLRDADKELLEGKTLLLPPEAGGMKFTDRGEPSGLLDGAAAFAPEHRAGYDVADEWYEDEARTLKRRVRLWDSQSAPEYMRRIRTIDTKPDAEEDEAETSSKRYWHWYEAIRDGDSDGSKGNKLPVLWQTHTDDVVKNVKQIAAKLPLPDEMKHALGLIAEWHDLGKQRPVFQKVLGNWAGNPLFAKSGKLSGRRGLREVYRHEFGSLVDVLSIEEHHAEFRKLSADMQDVALHLIATHHGRGRPHFPPDEATHPANGKNADRIAREVPRRFARLQRKYGRWGLAYLESLLRAADYAASAAPSKFYQEGQP